MGEVAQHARAFKRSPEDANLKVASVLSNILGKSGRAMLAALIAGETAPERLAALAWEPHAVRNVPVLVNF